MTVACQNEIVLTLAIFVLWKVDHIQDWGFLQNVLEPGVQPVVV